MYDIIFKAFVIGLLIIVYMDTQQQFLLSEITLLKLTVDLTNSSCNLVCRVIDVFY
jgi:hypothetical protein